MQHAFSEKQRKQMEETQAAGQQSRGKKVRQPKDFDAVYEAAKHYSKEGWLGIPAPAFRNAMISACRLVGIVMTRAKLSVFVEADGIDKNDGTPLVRIIGEPRIHEATVRNETGVADIRWRPMWEEWSAIVRVTWDEDQFSCQDVINLCYVPACRLALGREDQTARIAMDLVGVVSKSKSKYQVWNGRRGEAGHGRAWLGRHGRRGTAGTGARPGRAGRGRARQGMADMERTMR